MLCRQLFELAAQFVELLYPAMAKLLRKTPVFISWSGLPHSCR